MSITRIGDAKLANSGLERRLDKLIKLNEQQLEQLKEQNARLERIWRAVDYSAAASAAALGKG